MSRVRTPSMNDFNTGEIFHFSRCRSAPRMLLNKELSSVAQKGGCRTGQVAPALAPSRVQTSPVIRKWTITPSAHQSTLGPFPMPNSVSGAAVVRTMQRQRRRVLLLTNVGRRAGTRLDPPHPSVACREAKVSQAYMPWHMSAHRGSFKTNRFPP